jgi:hypothetical protein
MILSALYLVSSEADNPFLEFRILVSVQVLGRLLTPSSLASSLLTTLSTCKSQPGVGRIAEEGKRAYLAFYACRLGP